MFLPVGPAYKQVLSVRPTSVLFSSAGFSIYIWCYMQGKLPIYEIHYLIYVRAHVLFGDIGATFYTCTSPYLQRRYSKHHTLALYESISCEVLQGPSLARCYRVHSLRVVTRSMSCELLHGPYLGSCYRVHILHDVTGSVSCMMLKGPSLIFVRVHILGGAKGTISQNCTTVRISIVQKAVPLM